MRDCLRCQSQMLEGFDMKVDGAGYGVTIAKTTKFFAKRLEKPKVAICPHCGEISFYLENIDELTD